MSTLKSAIPPLAFLVFSLVYLSALDAGWAVCPLDPCVGSSTSSASGVLFACPQGDVDALSAKGLTISVTVHDCYDNPEVGVPATDIWLEGCSNLLALCGGGPGSITASGPTDVNGHTTITGAVAAGGCDSGVLVILRGAPLISRICEDPCLPITVRSADLDGNLIIDLVDFGAFASGYPVSPAPNDCRDFNGDGQVGVDDFAKFAAHYAHTC